MKHLKINIVFIILYNNNLLAELVEYSDEEVCNGVALVLFMVLNGGLNIGSYGTKNYKTRYYKKK